MLALIVLFLFGWYCLLNHPLHIFCSRRDRGPTKVSCSVWPDLLPVQSALWTEWGLGYGGKKRKKCCAYVLKIWVMKVHTSVGSVGNLSWLLHLSKCTCLCVCVCMCMHVDFFSRESTVTGRNNTYLRGNGTPPQDKLITHTKTSVLFYSCLKCKAYICQHQS